MFSSNTSSADGGYQISRSLRFNSADSAYLNRTPASAGNRTTWTWSAWVKRGDLSTATRGLFGAGTASSTDTGIYWTSADKIDFFDRSGGSLTGYVSTNAVFRDPSAWYHIVVVFDSGNATAANRMLIYINNVSQSLTVNNTLPQNTQSAVNNTVAHALGSLTGGSNVGNGYMTEVNFIDGQALTPSSFGETNAQTGVWQPKAYSGSYGTNGYYLNFSDNSNTTAATLGKDYSGNGNNWTPNNFSVAAGAGNDSLVDTPTPYGSDSGAGGEVRGNYSTMNPLDTGALNSTLSDGNLKVVTEIGNFRYMGNTIWTSAGKFYAEFKITADSGYAQVGIAVRTTTTNKILGVDSDSWSYNGWNGSSGNNNSFPAYGSAFGTGDTIGIAVDRDTNKLYFSKNGVWQNSSDPAAGTGSLNISGISGIPAMIAVCDNDNAGSCTFEVNFGQRPFAYTAPSGFRALNTQNLPTPTIGATTATQANKYFDVVLRNGGGPSGSTYSTTINMANGAWLWDKPRNQASSHYVVDSVRGLSQFLSTNQNIAEAAIANWFTGFNNGSFTTGTNDWGSGVSIVDWIWAANGTGVTNTAGSITSTVSANTTSGFSVVTYTGTGSNATVGHGLGAAPKMVITKKRSATSDWAVWHTSIANTEYLLLNSTAAKATGATYWNSTTPTSTLFSVGTADPTNISSATYVAYAFAEVPGYSKFGSYTGNGSADGPFVFTGMRPAFLMLKNTTTAGNAWHMIDTVRGTYNVYGPSLDANFSGAEITYTICDLLSNGFKLRDTNQAWNKSGDVYIIMAFASNPFKYSLAR